MIFPIAPFVPLLSHRSPTLYWVSAGRLRCLPRLFFCFSCMRQQLNQTERNKICHLYVRNELLLQLLAPLLSMTQPAAAVAATATAATTMTTITATFAASIVNLSDSNAAAS